uniref:NADH-ubiquinone oxidoreductase chain 6 n=1 Tax=Staphylinidae sp. BMNH 1274252 TaxID=1796573 RepID=A0A126TEW1_9COLE|nr:NADH dehydrogenase subunit 6 [Staphylinidae sp. BMNH 1274252]
MFFILFWILIMSLMFLTLNHPMTMGFILLIQTILIALMTGILNLNFWFSYVLFLIMVGGLLVIFIYMTSIASNELFNYSSLTSIMIIILLYPSIILFFLMDNFFIMKSFNWLENIMLKNNLFLMKFFNYPSFMIILLMIIYLLVTLIAIVKITKIEYGPLRQKF